MLIRLTLSGSAIFQRWRSIILYINNYISTNTAYCYMNLKLKYLIIYHNYIYSLLSGIFRFLSISGGWLYLVAPLLKLKALSYNSEICCIFYTAAYWSPWFLLSHKYATDCTPIVPILWYLKANSQWCHQITNDYVE